MDHSSPPWADYRALMEFRLVSLDKRPGVRPIGIGEILSRAISKLVMSAAGDQVNMYCGVIQLCTVIEASI